MKASLLALTVILSSAPTTQAAETAKCYQAEIAGVVDIVQTPKTDPKDEPKPDPDQVDCKKTPDAEECKKDETDEEDEGSFPRRTTDSDIFDDFDRYSDDDAKKTEKEKEKPAPKATEPKLVTAKLRTLGLVEDLAADTLEITASGGALKFSASYNGKHAGSSNKAKKARRYAAEFSDGAVVVIREIAESGKLALEMTTGKAAEGAEKCEEGCARTDLKTTRTIVLAPVRCR